MKFIATILFVLVISSSFAQDYSQVTFNKKGLYVMERLDPQDTLPSDSAFVFKLIEPKYVKVYKKMSIQGDSADLVRVLRKDSAHLFKTPEYCAVGFKLAIAFEYYNLSAQWSTHKLRMKDDTLTFSYDSLVLNGSLEMKKVENIPLQLDSSELAFPPGKYGAFTRYKCSQHTTTYQLIRNIQKALNKHGYGVPEDNKLETETRNALIDYQKKNNLLPVGILNVETLKHLGIEGY